MDINTIVVMAGYNGESNSYGARMTCGQSGPGKRMTLARLATYARRTPRGRLVALAAAAAVMVGAGCGDTTDARQPTGSDSFPGLDRELIAIVSAGTLAQPGGTDEMFYVDAAQARTDLRLSRDANVYGRGRRSRRLELFGSVGRTALLYANSPKPGPLVDAIDGGKIEAVTARQQLAFGAVMAVRTRQSFAAISSRLRSRGFVRRGRLLVSGRPPSQFEYGIVANAGGGIVVLANQRQTARAAVHGRQSKLTPAGRLLEAVPGVARIAGADRQGCVLRWAFGYGVVPPAGQYLLVLDHPADAARMKVAGKTSPGGGLSFRSAKATGNQVRASFRSHSRDQSPWAVFFGDQADDYDC